MYQYTVRVRGEKYLWGTSPCQFNLDLPMVLLIQNDLFGELIFLQTETKDGAASRNPPARSLQLRRGECFTFDLQGLSGVIAACDLNSNVRCTIISHSRPPQ
jgi:hypothetical protein